jgi:formylglycine-generating enzyme required for sulfatase activity
MAADFLMKIKQHRILKLLLVVIISIYSPFLHAQNFIDYSQDLKNETIQLEMIPVIGGSFLMGSTEEDVLRNADEKPSHEVELDDFWIGKYEVTWDQYDSFVYGSFNHSEFLEPSKLKDMGIDALSGATPPYVDMSFNMGKGSAPAVNMTQYAAMMFCKWLTAKTGVFYRLPTEAEWEYVCKKGKTDAIDTLNEIAWYTENSNEKYENTGAKIANSLGIHDMLGNVSEWTLDQYSTSYYEKSSTKNPWNVPTELYPKALRGGSWKDTADKLCCTSRQPSKSIWKRRDPQIPKSNWWYTDAPFIGFRVVRPRIQPSKKDIESYWLEAIIDF